MNIDYGLDYFIQEPSAKETVTDRLELFESFMESPDYNWAISTAKKISDDFPGYFYGWFAEARCLSEDFRRTDLLEKRENRKQFDNIIELLRKAQSLAPQQLSAEFEEIIISFTDKSEKSLAKSFVEKFHAIDVSLFEVENSSRYNCPRECSEAVYISYSKCEFFRMLMEDKEGTFYTLDQDLVERVGKKYPSIQIVKLHEKVIDYCLKLCKETESKHLSALSYYNTQVAMKGIEYTYDHEFKDDLWRYYPYAPYSGPSLESILRENKLDFSQAVYDENVVRAFRIFFSFMKQMELNVGDLSDIGLPQEYMVDFNTSYAPIKWALEEKNNAIKPTKKKSKRKTFLFIVLAIIAVILLINAPAIMDAIFG